MSRFELPRPPSVWDMYVGWGKSRRLSAEYEAWRMGAGLMLNSQKRKQGKVSGPFRASIAFRRPSKRSDIDNRIKPVLDLLQFVGIIQNDNLCESVSAVWGNDLPVECVVILQESVEALAA